MRHGWTVLAVILVLVEGPYLLAGLGELLTNGGRLLVALVTIGMLLAPILVCLVMMKTRNADRQGFVDTFIDDVKVEYAARIAERRQ